MASGQQSYFQYPLSSPTLRGLLPIPSRGKKAKSLLMEECTSPSHGVLCSMAPARAVGSSPSPGIGPSGDWVGRIVVWKTAAIPLSADRIEYPDTAFNSRPHAALLLRVLRLLSPASRLAV